jgi:hypothetical protein
MQRSPRASRRIQRRKSLPSHHALPLRRTTLLPPPADPSLSTARVMAVAPLAHDLEIVSCSMPEVNCLQLRALGASTRQLGNLRIKPTSRDPPRVCPYPRRQANIIVVPSSSPKGQSTRPGRGEQFSHRAICVPGVRRSRNGEWRDLRRNGRGQRQLQRLGFGRAPKHMSTCGAAQSRASCGTTARIHAS